MCTGTCKRVCTCMVLRPWQQGRPQQGLIWHLEPLGLGGKSGSSPSPPPTLQGAGSGARVVSGPLKLKSQDSRVTEDKDERSAFHIGRPEHVNAEKASIPIVQMKHSWEDCSGRRVYVIICPCGMPPPSSGSLKATTTCNSSCTCQVLQLEEPVSESESLASTPDRHRSHPSKYNSALEGPLRKASAHLGQVRRITVRLLPPVHTKARAIQ